MNMQPPPPPGPAGVPGGLPPGYQAYGAGPQPQQGNSGKAVAGMVLSLVGLIPCFWLLQVPGLLGLIFGLLGMSETKNDARRGRGMAIAGVVIGILLLVGCVAGWIYFATNAECYRDGTTWRCVTD